MLGMELSGTVNDQFLFTHGEGGSVHLRIKGTCIHISQLEELMLFTGEAVAGGADAVIITQNILQTNARQHRPVFVRCGKGNHIQLIIAPCVKIDDQFRCGRDKTKIDVGLDVDPVVHAEFFDRAMLRIFRNKQHADAALDLNINVTTELQKQRKALLRGKTPGLTNQCRKFCFVKIPKYTSVLQKRGTGSFILHLYHLRCGKYSIFLLFLLVHLRNSS